MTERNAWIGWVNRVDAAALSASSEASPDGLVGKLQTIRLAQVWRSESATAWFRADFGSAVAIDMLGLFGTDIAAADLVRHRLSAVSAGGYELLDAEAASGVQEGYAQHILPLDATIAARYWECRITAASLSGTGYFHVGRAWAGAALKLQSNPAFGATRGWRDLSRVTRGEVSGIRDSQGGAKLRTATFALSNMVEADHRAIEEMQRIAGLTGQVFFIPAPDDTEYRARDAILGGLDALNPLAEPSHDINASSFAITQDL